ncbi:hypothetical protein AG1IA_00811 [Rhizoctonia solani AG-1 IA]|uniref:Uncharacterized protein n=1 Tax=Thanatephorus cucumeris (strain AG1-IA) TaxID=983506 RepID=L8X927_THACA|nr:hypothetical protein AG1IA_00811 [Rhizoctonia solani AG-1 IA]
MNSSALCRNDSSSGDASQLVDVQATGFSRADGIDRKQIRGGREIYKEGREWTGPASDCPSLTRAGCIPQRRRPSSFHSEPTSQHTMAHVVDSRPRFNSYPTPISTNYPPSSSKAHYTYAAATPTTTPTKSHPSSSYHYRQASNSSHTRLPSAPASQSSSSRPAPRTSSSIPNPRSASSSVPPPTHRSNTLPTSSEPYSHSRKNSTSRTQLPTADAYRAAKREDERYASARVQQQQQYADAQAPHGGAPAQGPGTVLVRRDPAIGC